MHDDLVAGHGHQGGLRAGFPGDVGHRADRRRIDVEGEEIGQPQALVRRPAGAVDPQANEIHVAKANLLLDEPLGLVHLFGVHGALQVHADRPPLASLQRILHGDFRRQPQGADHLEPVGCQPLDESPVAQLRAGELPRLALANQHLLRLDGVVLPQFLQAGRR